MIRLILFFFFLPALSFGQKITTTEMGGEKNLYNDAIRQYITFVSKSDKTIFDTLFIQKDDILTDNLMPTIQKSRIVLLDGTGVDEMLKHENSFILHKVFPLRFENGKFWISIVPFRVHREKEELYFDNTGTCFVSYSFDCKTGELRCSRVAFAGL